MKDDNERPIFVEGGRWSKHNVCQSVALLSAFPNLSARELAVIDYIVSVHDRELSCRSEFFDVALSVNDIAEMLNLPKSNRTSAMRVVNNLLKYELIVVANKEKLKGQKAIYLPNVTKIRKAIKQHLKVFKCDREPSKEP
ncbi:MAG: hypothetical protein HDS77_03100 [Bacteroidales bacterium]|nr:hypothetical protein [Bacteroidales bacterium]MBD5235716.1 hypothetical protein [Barnesiella sp.]